MTERDTAEFTKMNHTLILPPSVDKVFVTDSSLFVTFSKQRGRIQMKSQEPCLLAVTCKMRPQKARYISFVLWVI